MTTKRSDPNPADLAVVGDLPRPVDADEVMRLVVEYGAECGIHSPLTDRAAELINQIREAVTR